MIAMRTVASRISHRQTRMSRFPARIRPAAGAPAPASIGSGRVKADLADRNAYGEGLHVFGSKRVAGDAPVAAEDLFHDDPCEPGRVRDIAWIATSRGA